MQTTDKKSDTVFFRLSLCTLCHDALHNNNKRRMRKHFIFWSNFLAANNMLAVLTRKCNDRCQALRDLAEMTCHSWAHVFMMHSWTQAHAQAAMRRDTHPAPLAFSRTTGTGTALYNTWPRKTISAIVMIGITLYTLRLESMYLFVTKMF